jgi:hypothetical protein
MVEIPVLFDCCFSAQFILPPFAPSHTPAPAPLFQFLSAGESTVSNTDNLCPFLLRLVFVMLSYPIKEYVHRTMYNKIVHFLSSSSRCTRCSKLITVTSKYTTKTFVKCL